MRKRLGKNLLDTERTADILCQTHMEWATPQYSRKEVNWAGLCIAGTHTVWSDELNRALDIVNNFRIAHAFPLNTIQNSLRTQASRIDGDSVVAQRLKRLISIWMKLDRFRTMRLWEMQDIGGCRAIVKDLESIDQLVDAFKSSRMRHKLAHEDDYVQIPRDSGYRSRHLVYRYMSDRNEIYNGLRVEIQIRTPLQHAWATAVETVDAFTHQALKSSRGERDWERLFQLMGTEMAFTEGTAPVPGTPADRHELRDQIRACADELQVIPSLNGFAAALRVTQRLSSKARDTDYFLLSLDNVKEVLDVTSYRKRELTLASRDYALKESEIRDEQGKDAVLVSIDSIRNLRRAYPNYFADTNTFVRALTTALSE